MPLTEKQMSYLALAWQCFETEPKIDYDKFKTVAGLASSHSARELMRVTKKKLKEEYGALSGSITTSNIATVNGTGKASPSKVTKNTPKRPRAKKAASELADGGSDEGEDESPSKKAKTSATKVNKEPSGGALDDGDDDDGLGMFQ